MLYEIWSLGHTPFEDVDRRDVNNIKYYDHLTIICIQYMQKITIGYRLAPPPGCPQAVYELMIKCW